MIRRDCLALALMLVMGCMAPSVAHAAPTGPISLRMDCEGTEALLGVLGQRTVTEADLDRLLSIRGVQAMVDNTTKYLPSDTREVFRSAVKEYVRTGKSTVGHFYLDESVAEARNIRTLVGKLRADGAIDDITAPVLRYMPPLPHLTATIYGVVGGVSDGFVLDGRPEPAFYVALNRAEGDVDGVKLNMAHELYHVVQRTARASVPGLDAQAFDSRTAPPPVHLLAVIVEEGTATYVAEPLLAKRADSRPPGPYLANWRAAYAKNASPGKIAENFQEVDCLLASLRAGSMTWDEASDRVFRGYGPGPYFVGYEMARAIDRHYGAARLAALQQQHPAEFLRTYIDIYRHDAAAVPARFDAATEAYVDALLAEAQGA